SPEKLERERRRPPPALPTPKRRHRFGPAPCCENVRRLDLHPGPLVHEQRLDLGAPPRRRLVPRQIRKVHLDRPKLIHLEVSVPQRSRETSRRRPTASAVPAGVGTSACASARGWPPKRRGAGVEPRACEASEPPGVAGLRSRAIARRSLGTA